MACEGGKGERNVARLYSVNFWASSCPGVQRGPEGDQPQECAIFRGHRQGPDAGLPASALCCALGRRTCQLFSDLALGGNRRF